MRQVRRIRHIQAEQPRTRGSPRRNPGQPKQGAQVVTATTTQIPVRQPSPVDAQPVTKMAHGTGLDTAKDEYVEVRKYLCTLHSLCTLHTNSAEISSASLMWDISTAIKDFVEERAEVSELQQSNAILRDAHGKIHEQAHQVHAQHVQHLPAEIADLRRSNTGLLEAQTQSLEAQSQSLETARPTYAQEIESLQQQMQQEAQFCMQLRVERYAQQQSLSEAEDQARALAAEVEELLQKQQRVLSEGEKRAKDLTAEAHTLRVGNEALQFTVGTLCAKDEAHEELKHSWQREREDMRELLERERSQGAASLQEVEALRHHAEMKEAVGNQVQQHALTKSEDEAKAFAAVVQMLSSKTESLQVNVASLTAKNEACEQLSCARKQELLQARDLFERERSQSTSTVHELETLHRILARTEVELEGHAQAAASLRTEVHLYRKTASLQSELQEAKVRNAHDHISCPRSAREHADIKRTFQYAEE